MTYTVVIVFKGSLRLSPLEIDTLLETAKSEFNPEVIDD